MVEKKIQKKKIHTVEGSRHALVIPAGAAATISTRRGGMRCDGGAVLVAIGHIGDQGFNIVKKNIIKKPYLGLGSMLLICATLWGIRWMCCAER